MSRYSKWAQREYPPSRPIAVSLLAGVIFVGVLPCVVLLVGPNLDRGLGLPRLDAGPASWVVGGFLLVAGLFFALWSILAQLRRGRGTPLPMMPTQESLTQGPFRFCRNPMTLGTILAHLGRGVIAGTIAGIGLVLRFAVFLVLCLMQTEECGLAARFGDAYLQYRREVPFIIPRLWRCR